MRGPDDPILGYCSRLLRGGEGDPSVAPAVLAATVRAHGVAGLLLETAPMSQPALAPQRVVLMGLARQDAVRDMAATLEVRRVLDILDEAGIASLVLKGRRWRCGCTASHGIVRAAISTCLCPTKRRRRR